MHATSEEQSNSRGSCFGLEVYVQLSPSRQNGTHHEQNCKVMSGVDEPQFPWFSVPEHAAERNRNDKTEPAAQCGRETGSDAVGFRICRHEDEYVGKDVTHEKRAEKRNQIAFSRSLLFRLRHFFRSHTHERGPAFLEQDSIPQKADSHGGDGGHKNGEIVNRNSWHRKTEMKNKDAHAIV